LESLLIINDSYELSCEWLAVLRQQYRLHFVKNTWDAQNMIEKHSIDVLIMMSKQPLQPAFEKFLAAIDYEYGIKMPVIFVSDQLTKALSLHLLKKGNWYFSMFPPDDKEFLRMLAEAMKITQITRTKVIILERRGSVYPYQVNRITRIGRSKLRHIKIYSFNEQTGKEETQELSYNFPLATFLVNHGLETYFWQVQQSWLVNKAHIKEINSADQEIILTNGVVVPSSKQYIEEVKEKLKASVQDGT